MRKHWRRFIIRLRRAMLKHLVEERTKQHLRACKEAREDKVRIDEFQRAGQFSDIRLLIEFEDASERLSEASRRVSLGSWRD